MTSLTTFGTKKGHLATKIMGIQSLQVSQLLYGEPEICSIWCKPIYPVYFGNHQCGSNVLTNRIGFTDELKTSSLQTPPVSGGS